MSEVVALRRASSRSRALVILSVSLLLLLGGIFSNEVMDAIQVWNASTAYNHCFLILPIAVWLAWHRRARLEGVPLRPTVLALPAALVIGAVWFAADRLGVMVGRQLAVITFVQLLFFSVLGWRLYRALLVPLLYLYFLVPFGGFLVPLLQTFSTHFVVTGLNLIGIPNFNDGNVIEIPQGAFYIAEACAGLRFLIAAIAFGVLYAVVIYKSSVRRLLFMIASVFVPVIANGFRCLGIVWLGNVLGSASAAATDHVLYGYLFFSIVLLLLILLGLAFREDAPSAHAIKPRTNAAKDARATSIIPAVAIIVCAAIFPLLTLGINRAAAATRPVIHAAFPGCEVTPGGATTALPARGAAFARYSCANGTVTLDLAAFAPRSDPRRVLRVARALSGEDTDEAQIHVLRVPNAKPARWDLVLITHPAPAATANALWFDGKPARGNLRTRARQALNSLLGSRSFPLVVSLRATGSQAKARLGSFLQNGGVPAATLERVAAGLATP